MDKIKSIKIRLLAGLILFLIILGASIYVVEIRDNIGGECLTSKDCVPCGEECVSWDEYSSVSCIELECLCEVKCGCENGKCVTKSIKYECREIKKNTFRGCCSHHKGIVQCSFSTIMTTEKGNLICGDGFTSSCKVKK